MDIALADVLDGRGIVRSAPWINQCDSAVVLTEAVARGPGDDQLRLPGTGLGARITPLLIWLP